MRTFTTLALGVAAVTQVGAVTIQKNDASAVDLYGRVQTAHVFGESPEGTNPGSQSTDGIKTYIRLGLKGASQVTNSYGILGHFETQLGFSDTEKPFDSAQSGSTNNLRVRLAYAGFNTDWGKVTFGRQLGAVTLVSNWADKSLSGPYAGAGLGTGVDKFGTDRASSILQFTRDWNGLTFKSQYQFRSDASVNNGEDQPSYGLALSYTIEDYGLSLGTGYNKGSRPGDDADSKIFILGARYVKDGFYGALTWASGSDFASSGQNHDGLEAALRYSFGNGWHIASIYNRLQYDANGSLTTAKYKPVNFYTLSAKYDFSDNLVAIVDYRVNSGKTSATAEEYKDDVLVVLRYSF